MGGFASSTTSVLSFIGEPPDLSQISDPSVVVLFKNLSKKEEVTKAKALEGLLTALDSVESIEEALLSAWVGSSLCYGMRVLTPPDDLQVRLYPRLSIDVSARVRRLSNSLQGLIGVKSGKKLARHMAKIVGPWLCGLFDSDRGSARATLESLLKVFKSEEKLKTIWKAYHAAILEFCKTSVASESVYSLSDERWVVPDDAEAKFARIMATCCLAVAHLITNQPSEELDESYREFFGEKTLWTFTFHADPFLRRAVYRLLQDTLERRPEWIVSNLEMVSTALIMKASAKSQVASVTTYLETLVALTKQFPESWSMAKPAKKKTPLAQFVSFVEHGSQVAPPSYWDQVSSVLMILPKDVLAVQEEGTKSVLTGILKGIKAGPEPRSHMTAAWGCYWDCCYRFLDLQFSWSGFDDFLLQQSIFAVYDGYVSGCQPKDRCFISNDDAVAATVCGNGLVKLDHLSQGTAVKVLDEAWEKVEGSVISTVRAERSDTVANAPAVKRCAETWVKLVVGVLKQLPKNGVVYQAIVKSNIAVFAELIESLLFTNGIQLLFSFSACCRHRSLFYRKGGWCGSIYWNAFGEGWHRAAERPGYPEQNFELLSRKASRYSGDRHCGNPARCLRFLWCSYYGCCCVPGRLEKDDTRVDDVCSVEGEEGELDYLTSQLGFCSLGGQGLPGSRAGYLHRK